MFGHLQGTSQATKFRKCHAISNENNYTESPWAGVRNSIRTLRWNWNFRYFSKKKKFLLPLPQRTQGLNGRFLKRRISPFQFVGWIHRHLFMQPTGNAVMILRHPPQKEEKLPVPAGALIMAVNNKIRPNSFTVALHFVRNRRITSLSIHNKFFQVTINLNIWNFVK